MHGPAAAAEEIARGLVVPKVNAGRVPQRGQQILAQEIATAWSFLPRTAVVSRQARAPGQASDNFVPSGSNQPLPNLPLTA